MIEKLKKAAERYEQLGDLLGGGQVLAGSAQYKELMKEFSDMSELIAKYEEYRKADERISEALELLEMGDKELSDLAKEDMREANRITDKYDDTIIDKISDRINDFYLKSSGSDGVVSYSYVVRLVISYYESER